MLDLFFYFLAQMNISEFAYRFFCAAICLTVLIVGFLSFLIYLIFKKIEKGDRE